MSAVQELAATPRGLFSKDWDDGSAGIELQKYAKSKWLPLPSNTQFVKSGVKEAKICISNNRDEASHSMYATVRSSIIESSKKPATINREQKSGVLKGNQFMTTGRIRQWKHKLADGGKENESEKDIKNNICGKFRKEAVLSSARQAMINQAGVCSDELEEVKTKMKHSNHFDHQHCQDKVHQFNDSKDKERQPNVIIRGGEWDGRPDTSSSWKGTDHQVQDETVDSKTCYRIDTPQL